MFCVLCGAVGDYLNNRSFQQICCTATHVINFLVHRKCCGRSATSPLLNELPMLALLRTDAPSCASSTLKRSSSAFSFLSGNVSSIVFTWTEETTATWWRRLPLHNSIAPRQLSSIFTYDTNDIYLVMGISPYSKERPVQRIGLSGIFCDELNNQTGYSIKGWVVLKERKTRKTTAYM